MTGNQAIVAWIGIALILMNLFLTDQWSIVWGNTIGRGSFHTNLGAQAAKGVDPNFALPGGTGPLPTPSGKQKKPIGVV